MRAEQIHKGSYVQDLSGDVFKVIVAPGIGINPHVIEDMWGVRSRTDLRLGAWGPSFRSAMIARLQRQLRDQNARVKAAVDARTKIYERLTALEREDGADPLDRVTLPRVPEVPVVLSVGEEIKPLLRGVNDG